MSDRNVSPEEAEVAVQNPDAIEGSVKGRINVFKLINGRHLRVTCREENGYILVITVAIRKKPFKE